MPLPQRGQNLVFFRIKICPPRAERAESAQAKKHESRAACATNAITIQIGAAARLSNKKEETYVNCPLLWTDLFCSSFDGNRTQLDLRLLTEYQGPRKAFGILGSTL